VKTQIVLLKLSVALVQLEVLELPHLSHSLKKLNKIKTVVHANKVIKMKEDYLELLDNFNS
jgi:hypothetical protein